MAIVNYENLPSENTPLTGGATGNLMIMQENGTTHGTDTKLSYSQSFLNDKIVNIGSNVDSTYNTNLIKGKNLYDKNTYFLNNGLWISGYNIGANSSGWYVVVPIVGGKTYTISKKNSGVLYTTTTAIYPSNGVARLDSWGGGDNLSSRTITTNSNAKFLFIGLLTGASPTTEQKTTAIEELQVEEGDTATTYEEFVPNSIYVNGDKFAETIGIGESVDSTNRVNLLKGKNLFDKTNIVSNYRLSSEGSLYADNGYFTSDFIKVKPNTTYTTNIEPSGTKRICEYDSYKTLIIANSDTNQITTSATTQYIIIVGLLTELDTTMFVEGDSIPNTYKSYVTPSINVDAEEIYSKPVVLFNDPNGQFDNISLNDNKSNYSKLEVYYVDDQNFQNCMILDNSNNPFQLQFVKSSANRGSMYFISTRFYYTSQTIFKRGQTTIYNLINGVITENTTADVLKITKILGYK